MNRRIIVILIGTLVLLLALPLVVAERYTSPTQDGQYLGNPLRAYRFAIAAATVSPASELNTSGEALERAKRLFADSGLRPNRVELLFLGGADEYTYVTRAGDVLSVKDPGAFIWEVWGVEKGSDGSDPSAPPDVVALLDYQTGALLDSLE